MLALYYTYKLVVRVRLSSKHFSKTLSRARGKQYKRSMFLRMNGFNFQISVTTGAARKIGAKMLTRLSVLLTNQIRERHRFYLPKNLCDHHNFNVDEKF